MQFVNKFRPRGILSGLAVVPLLVSLNSLAQGVDLKKDLKSYWSFDGNLKDGTANKFDGSENGTAPIAFVAGKFGKAIELDGIDQFVQIEGGDPDDLSFGGDNISSFTISGWFKVGTFDKSWEALVMKGENNNWRLHRHGGDQGLAFHSGGGDTPIGTPPADNINDGNWHHFAAVSDQDVVNYGTGLYIDGVLSATIASKPNTTANGKRVMIGDNPDARGRYWNGQVDDVAMWSRALNEAEIAKLYNGGAGTSVSSLLGNGPVDTDKDGIPDDWELKYGLNPNDATDAAKDLNKNGISNLDEFKLGFDPTDTVQPTIVSAKTSGTFDTIVLNFSRKLDEASAGAASNYVIAPSLVISAVAVKGSTVTLTTAKQTPGGTAYTVTVNNVLSDNKLKIANNSKVIFYSYLVTKAGVLRFAYWGGIGGTPVQGLLDDPRYPATPDLVAAVLSFDSRGAFPDDSHESYGATIEGFLTPTESGNYRFFSRSDDSSQLLLSTDDTEAKLAQIAEETGCCKGFNEPDHPTTSESIALVAGKKYFIRLIYKEGGGGDYGQVAWRKEGDKTPAGSLKPIPGKFLSSAVDLPFPSEGLLNSQSPGVGAKNVSPATAVTIVHTDGKTAWTAANVTLKIDGDAVTPTPLTKEGAVATIKYQPAALLASKTKHIVNLSYLDAGGKAATLEWSFEVAPYSGTTKDKVAGYPGLILGSATYTADLGGHTGKAGDYGIDLTKKGGPVATYDSAFAAAANAATAKDEVSVVFWQKKEDVADSSAFALSSPSAGNQRVFHAHVPWSNQHIYFDTTGCCDGTTQRIEADIATFPDYTDATFWTSKWHLFAFTKKGSAKNIWIDGKLFLSGDSTNPLQTDIDSFYMGAGGGGAELSHAVIDDFSVYGKELVEADIKALFTGTLPTALPPAKGLIAYWDFNAVTDDTSTITKGLVAYWNFDGNLQDSVKDHHGTGKGTGTIPFVDSRDGFGKAIQLDGKTQYVEITGGNDDELEFPKGSMSIAGWFKVGAFDKSWQALLSKGEGSNYRIARRGDAQSIAYAGGTGEGADDVPNVNDGAWHQFVTVSDATVIPPFGTAIYIDGVLHGVNTNMPVLTATTKHLFIGENPDSTGRQWNGAIDDIALWNRPLTGPEVNALWNSGKGLVVGSLPRTATSTISAQRSGANIIINFTGTLQSTDSLSSPWADVPGATSPVTVAPSGAQKYYRYKP